MPEKFFEQTELERLMRQDIARHRVQLYSPTNAQTVRRGKKIDIVCRVRDIDAIVEAIAPQSSWFPVNYRIDVDLYVESQAIAEASLLRGRTWQA